MPILEVLVPDIGDFDQVAVIEVLVRPGDEIAAEAPVVTLESDKATMDVPSPVAGIVREVRVAAGAKVGEGAILITVEVAAKATAPAAPPEAAPPQQTAAASPAVAPVAIPDPPVAPTVPRAAATANEEPAFAKAYASPATRRFARELGVPLGRVEGSGRNGRILREDVQAFVKRALAQPATGVFALPEMPRIDFSKFGPVVEQPLSRIQKLTGQNLHRAWLHVPHVTQHEDADITELEEFRKENGEAAAAQGFKLTLLAFVMKASVAALRRHPRCNASLASGGESLILKQYFHLGVAVDTADGLVVPVVRDVDRKGIFDLARELSELSARARDKKLKMDDLQGGSFTISSLGGIGGTGFTPIVNAPEVAILGVSRAVWKPVYRDGAFVPRLLLPLSLSYDHRVIDGALAARFAGTVAAALADPRKMLL
jgi:pyruvate dehydrogenase E2 component (dihydrolipoamide acetyltransferase)